MPQRVQILGNRRDAWSEYQERADRRRVPGGRSRGKTTVEAFNSHLPPCRLLGGFPAGARLFCLPCHTSAFDLKGKALNQVSPRDMDSLDCEIRDAGEIWVKYQDFLSGTPHKIPKA